jgi:hypothetical protein
VSTKSTLEIKNSVQDMLLKLSVGIFDKAKVAGLSKTLGEKIGVRKV